MKKNLPHGTYEKKKTTIGKITQNVDSDTGEILDTVVQTIAYEKEPDYVKLYLHDIVHLMELNHSEQKMFYALLRKMNFDCEVVLTSLMRKTIADDLKMPLSTFKTSISSLIGKGVMMRKSNNQFLMNPNLVARGSWRDIQKIIIKVTYSADGKMLETNFDNQPKIPFPENKDFYPTDTK